MPDDVPDADNSVVPLNSTHWGHVDVLDSPKRILTHSVIVVAACVLFLIMSVYCMWSL